MEWELYWKYEMYCFGLWCLTGFVLCVCEREKRLGARTRTDVYLCVLYNNQLFVLDTV